MHVQKMQFRNEENHAAIRIMQA